MSKQSDYKEFINDLKGVKDNRHHKITKSYGVYDYYKRYRKNKPKDAEFRLTESQYFSIIRKINQHLATAILSEGSVKLPCSMGKIELRRYKIEPKIDQDGKLVYKAPIDWDATLKLWYEDKEEYDKKTLIKIISKDNFRIIYNKNNAQYANKSFFSFNINRELKKNIYEAAKDGIIDGFTYNN